MQVPPHLIEVLDKEVGPQARSIVYAYLLVEPMSFSSPSIPWWQRFMWGLGPFQAQVRQVMYDAMVKSDEHVDECRVTLRAALAKLEPLLAAEPCFAVGRDGQQPGGGALALAALLAPVVWPPTYPSHGYAPSDSLADQPEALQTEVRAWRATAVGQWVMEAYPELSARVRAVAEQGPATKVCG